jgi:hypothetical protein
MGAICFKNADIKKKDLECDFVVEPVKMNASSGIALRLCDQVDILATGELLELVDCELG